MTNLRVVVGAATDVGPTRAINEDALGFVHGGTGDVLVVCDGLGGHQAGEVASQLARDVLLAHILAGGPQAVPRDVLSNSIGSAHRAVTEAAASSEDQEGMGTTCVIALVRDGVACVANVGDSRAYLIRDGVAQQLTRDHNKAQEMLDYGIITESQAQDHPQKAMLSQALGQSSPIRPGVVEVELRVGDTLLLSSDGVHDALSQDQLVERAGARNPHFAAADLVSLACENDGQDNATAVVARVVDTDIRATVLESEVLSGDHLEKVDTRPSGLPTHDGTITVTVPGSLFPWHRRLPSWLLPAALLGLGILTGWFVSQQG